MPADYTPNEFPAAHPPDGPHSATHQGTGAPASAEGMQPCSVATCPTEPAPSLPLDPTATADTQPSALESPVADAAPSDSKTIATEHTPPIHLPKLQDENANPGVLAGIAAESVQTLTHDPTAPGGSASAVHQEPVIPEPRHQRRGRPRNSTIVPYALRPQFKWCVVNHALPDVVLAAAARLSRPTISQIRHGSRWAQVDPVECNAMDLLAALPVANEPQAQAKVA